MQSSRSAQYYSYLGSNHATPWMPPATLDLMFHGGSPSSGATRARFIMWVPFTLCAYSQSSPRLSRNTRVCPSVVHTCVKTLVASSGIFSRTQSGPTSCWRPSLFYRVQSAPKLIPIKHTPHSVCLLTCLLLHKFAEDHLLFAVLTPAQARVAAHSRCSVKTS